ncbi:hypothetical protein EV667_0233 [Ancylobacter aquaticus]|uniref:Uncharacterized protein n=1 Tax=Ancylobacter aquaticus TaxID=100 RepID=A0A4V2PJW2_ANCAQ|nr:hypothetical protein EV667_0233 [Ancylobacter aquaticus]
MNDEEDEGPSPPDVATGEPMLLGLPQDPHIGGEMALSEAIYWIASEGGATPFDARDAGIWRKAADALHMRIVDGSVLLMGRRHGLGFAERVDGVLLSGVEMNPPYAVNAPFSLIMGRRPYIDYVGRASREQWQDWAHDDLHGANRVPEYTHLQVRAPDIARIWPFPARLAAPLEASECDETSSRPGRPTDEQVRAIIEQENERRAISKSPNKVTQNEAGELVRSLGFSVDRLQVRSIARELKGNNKSGPQGPRK